jgi:L-ribulose-5-phosphate 3-epimerase
MGMGLVNVFRYATVLRDIGFDGPMELEAEYPIGGAESGADTLTLPRLHVLGSMKRDVLTIRAAFDQSGAGLTI